MTWLQQEENNRIVFLDITKSTNDRNRIKIEEQLEQQHVNDDIGYITPPLRDISKEYAKYEMDLDKVRTTPSPLIAHKRKRMIEYPSSYSTSYGQILAVESSINSLSSSNDNNSGKSTTNTTISTARPSTPTVPSSASVKRKANSDFLRKGQWTSTEERLAKLLIEAFEEGYLPIYTGIRLRGYLAIQLQCDPMRVSKKLCAGTIDGKKIPKNYGQKKYKLRKKQLWDREEATRILSNLDRFTKELWHETGISPPSHLTLSSTRNADEEEDYGEITGRQLPPSSPVKKLSPKTKMKHENSVALPIIYLNLSKKMKSDANVETQISKEEESEVTGPFASDDCSLNYMESNGMLTTAYRYTVDIESFQAAKDLIELHHHEYRSTEEFNAACEFVTNAASPQHGTWLKTLSTSFPPPPVQDFVS